MISIVVLNWNSGAFLRRVLDSIDAQSSREFELIVVDNGSTNGSLATIDEFRARGTVHRFIALGENVGFAAGMNAGIDVARGELVVALNSDACIAPNFVEALARAYGPMRHDARIGMIAVPVYDWEYGDGRDRLTNRLQAAGVSFVRRLTVSSWHPAFERPDQLFGPSGAAAVFTRGAVAAARDLAGHFYDPAYFAYAEDIDVYLRLNALGLRCVSCDGAAVWHIGSASLGGNFALRRKPPNIQRMVHLNKWRTFAKIGSRWTRWRMLPWVVFDDACRVAVGPRRVQTARMYLANYAVYRGLRPRRYPARPLPFAGSLFSRSGWAAVRGRRLPSPSGTPPLHLQSTTDAA